MDRKTQICKAGQQYLDSMDEFQRYHTYPRAAFIDGAEWSDEHPKPGTVNKQEFIKKTISYFTPILKTYCSEECVKELIDGFVNSIEKGL